MGANNSFRAERIGRRTAAGNWRTEIPERLMSRTELETGLRYAYRGALEFFQEVRLEMDDYGHKIPAEKLAADKARVLELKTKFGQDPLTVERMAATVTEGALCHAAADCGWFGPEAKTYATTLYDDYINGVDMLVELKTGKDAYTPLAIDATLGQMTIFDKARRIKREIDEGTLASLDYFEGEEGKVGLSGIAKVIVHLDPVTAARLGKLSFGESRDDALMAKNVAQLRVLGDIKGQLELYRDYAIQVGKQDIADKYSEALKAIEIQLGRKSEELRMPLDKALSDKDTVADRLRRSSIFKKAPESTQKEGRPVPRNIRTTY